MEIVFVFCFSFGVLFFLTLIFGKLNPDNPLFIFSTVFCVLLGIFGVILYPVLVDISYKIEQVKNYEFHKFTGYICIVVGNDIWNYKDSKLYNILNENSDIKLKRHFNFYKSEIKKTLIIDGVDY